MNKVLLRPLFKKKYIDYLKKTNSFKKGGLASIQKFNVGGLSRAERTNLTLAPFTSALLTAQRRPGESEMSAVARALGRGVGQMGETRKTIAAIEQSMRPEDQFKILTKEEIEVENQKGANLNPQGTYQKNIATNEIKELTKRQLFAEPFKTALAPVEAKRYGAVMEAGSAAQAQSGTLKIIEALATNPDLTLGQFGNLTKSVETFAEGLGFSTNLTDLAAADVLQRYAGQKVLADLGQLKGALSEKELKFIQSLNVGVDTPRESILLIVQLYKNANNLALAKSKLYNDHVAMGLAPSSPDKNGKTLYQKEAELSETVGPLLTPEIEARLKGETKQIKKNVDKQFERQTIVVTEKNIEAVRQNVPDAQLGDQFQLRGKTLVKVK